MGEMKPKKIETISIEKYVTLKAGTRVRIILDEDVPIIDETVPAGKRVRGRISIEGSIE